MEAIQELAQERDYCSSWLVSQSAGDLLKFYENNRYVRSEHLSVYSRKFDKK